MINKNGADGIDGRDGRDGRDGIDGIDGKDGKTPIFRVDFFTKKDEEDLVSKILRFIKVPKKEEVVKDVLDTLKEDDVLGVKKLQGDVSSYRQQLAFKQAGQHGGGDTVVAGDNISLTRNTNGTTTINALGGGGSVDSVNGQTGVVVLDTGDIAETTDHNYVTDAQQTVIQNTSGTNTGDNAVNSLYAGLEASKQDVLTGLTASVVELNYTDGVTSAIQTQLDNKLDDTQFSGLSKISVGTTTPVAPATGDLWVDTN